MKKILLMVSVVVALAVGAVWAMARAQQEVPAAPKVWPPR